MRRSALTAQLMWTIALFRALFNKLFALCNAKCLTVLEKLRVKRCLMLAQYGTENQFIWKQL